MSDSSKKKTVRAEEIEKTIEVVSSSSKIPPEQLELLILILKTFLLLIQMLNSKKVTVLNLRKLIYGPKTEKMSKKRGVRSKKKKKRNTENDNKEKVNIEHKKLKAGDKCPECNKGRLYTTNDQKETVYKGQNPFVKTIFLYAVLRCNFCGMYYRAEETKQVKKVKASGVSNLALLRYRMGLPH